jgi:DNA-binding Xre family transcriptional regulator
MTVKINSGLVRTILAKNDMTIGELAAAVGVSHQTIHNLLNGGAFKTDTLGRLAAALETTPSRLIDPRDVEIA